ncbi:pentatricopeptide repeat-containing protein At1g73710 [Impatiens glandulifera]|uniref:pentatricopeptide repeat-containing protein At1g73710 n=1 Tax=Impatiens glandulifera TaxID=253017 RepID=UPI001FB1A05C|nr:pentatricopeptide repeat-containing protein At1g73710 [Impatiens glandulifera]
MILPVCSPREILQSQDNLMIIRACNPMEIGHGNLQNSFRNCNLFSCKLQYFPAFTARVSLGNYSSYDQQFVERQDNCPLSTQKRTKVYSGINLHCSSRTLPLPTKTFINGKRNKRYGGILPSVLRSLESEENIEKALNLYHGKLSPKEQTVIIKEQRNWERVVKVFHWIKSQEDYIPNVIHYNVVLRSLGQAQKWDELRRCWIMMAQDGVLPTNNTYGMLVDVYGKAGLAKEAILWIKHMKIRGIFPDEVTMNTVVRVMKDVREFDRADSFYKAWCIGKIELDDLEFDSLSATEPYSLKHFLSTELFKIGGRGHNIKEFECSSMKPKLTATYNTLIDLYGKAGRLNDAANIFSEMLKSGVMPDTVTFNTMIHICGTNGKMSEAEALFNKMDERGVLPDTKTFNILSSLHANAGNIDETLRYYRKIREVGLTPDVVTHRGVLHVLCERNMVGEVEVILKEMRKFGVSIDEQSLPVLVKMFVDQGMLEQAARVLEESRLSLCSKTRAAVINAYAEKGLWAEAENVFYRKDRQSKDVSEYNVMFKAYGMAKLYDKALSLFNAMKQLGTWPDECSFNTLIQMLSGCDLIEQAKELLNETGCKPSCLSFASMISSYIRLNRLSDAVSIYEMMIRLKVEPNEVVYGLLIDAFAETGDLDDCLRYFHSMEKFGIFPNQVILTSMIKAYNKVGSLKGAKSLYEKIRDPDTIASNSMLNIYADLGILSEAKLIMNDLRKKGRADGVSFATMMYLYRNLGMLDEAIEVAEEMKQTGLLRDCDSFNKVMACYATNGQLLECAKLLHEMVNRKLFPDATTFKTLFKVLSKGGVVNEAVEQLELAYVEGKPFARQAVITCVYSVVGLRELAIESCRVLMKDRVGLGLFAYNVAIYVYDTVGEIDRALNVYMKMQDEGLEPDIVTYVNLVGCYGKAGMIEGVRRVYGQLKYGVIEPNQSLFEALANAFRNAGRHDQAELVEQEMRFSLATESQSNTDSERDDLFK